MLQKSIRKKWDVLSSDDSFLNFLYTKKQDE